MKLLKTNKWLAVILITLIYSCSNNSLQIDSYKNHIISNLTSETQKESKSISTQLLEFKIKQEIYYQPSAVEKTEQLSSFKDSLNQIILDSDSLNDSKIISIKNNLLYKFATYKEGEKQWGIDTIHYSLSNCNPRDTMLISKTLRQFELVTSSKKIIQNLKRVVILQLTENIFKAWKGKFDIVVFSCFGPVPESKLLTKNKVFYQNETSYIYPNIYIIDYDYPIYIFKENTNQFIMENGEKKAFTNPITLKAPSKKGVHTVKGEILIKQKGELVPKPFEFRYIVE